MLKFEMPDRFKGTGISFGLDRGLLISYGGCILLEEGMGLGACAIQTGGHTYFATETSCRATEGSVEASYCINKRLERRIAGVRFDLLTRMMEFICSNIYMKLENKQNSLLRLAVWFQKIFRIEVIYVEIPPIAEITVRHNILDSGVTVDLCCKSRIKECTLFVMNELGANVFDQGLKNGEPIPPPSGWQRYDGQCELFSSTYKLAFSFFEKQDSKHAGSSIFWGRELSDSHCWAGFESEIPINNGSIDHYIYSVRFREVTE